MQNSFMTKVLDEKTGGLKKKSMIYLPFSG
jgi:hypothetical protein